MYDDMKTFDGQTYTGMRVGGTHHWNYRDSEWVETKEAPDRWQFQFNCVKTRAINAPVNTGASLQTKYHWYILADQIATKLDENAYMTSMTGLKFKVGHQRPYWRAFSYDYPGQLSYKERIIAILEETLRQLKGNSVEIDNPLNICKSLRGTGFKSSLDSWLTG
jgi:hypothetical protein